MFCSHLKLNVFSFEWIALKPAMIVARRLLVFFVKCIAFDWQVTASCLKNSQTKQKKTLQKTKPIPWSLQMLLIELSYYYFNESIDTKFFSAKNVRPWFWRTLCVPEKQKIDWITIHLQSAFGHLMSMWTQKCSIQALYRYVQCKQYIIQTFVVFVRRTDSKRKMKHFFI